MKHQVDAITLSGIRSFSEYCQQFDDIVYLTIGEPDFDTPEAIKDAAIRALRENVTHYPPAIGMPRFRAEVAAFETKKGGYPIDTDEVIVTNGATEGIVCAMWTSLTAGDSFIVPVPCFALYFSQLELIGVTPIRLENADDHFQITQARFDECVKTNPKGIILTSPNNPTGAVLNQASLDVVADYARLHPEFTIILDDVYDTFAYDGDVPTLRMYPELRDQIIVVQSFSKSYAMTGWRLGYVIANAEKTQAMHRLHQNLVTGVASFVQEAGCEALQTDNTYMVEDYRIRRDYVVKRLNAMGLYVEKPAGAFYIFPKVTQYDTDSIAFAKRCLREAKVAVIPGVYFGQEGYIRISYCYAFDVLEEAMDRLEQFLQK